MGINNSNKILTKDGLETLVTALNIKNNEQATLIYSDINANSAAIEAEIQRAQDKEKEILNNLEAEVVRAKEADESFKQEDINLYNKISETNTRIDNEKSDRENAVANLSDAVFNKIETESTNIKSELNIQIASVKSDLETADVILVEKINNEVKEREALTNNVNTIADAIDDRIDQIDLLINNHADEYQRIYQAFASHESNRENPHKVTREQLEAASTQEVEELSATVSQNVASIDSINSNIIDINNTLKGKLDNTGNATLTGSLIIAKQNNSDPRDGDLTVQGDLIVNGTTITQNHETINVENNFIVINSDGQDISSALAGIAIKTDSENAYGIAYNPSDDSVSLGQGTISSDGNFLFSENESNPILTRAKSSDLSDQNFLIWDANSKKAIDSGLNPASIEATYATNSDLTSVDTQVQKNTSSIGELTGNIASINSAIDSINAVNNTQTTNIAEINTSVIGISDIINTHRANTTNPHNVTWSQINPDAFNDAIKPIMDSGVEGQSGTSTLVARIDHVHPTDTSRLSVDHEKLVATSTKLGHVMLADTIGDAVIDPVSGKAIYSFVKNEINNISADIKINSNKVITKLTQENGKLACETTDISISISQVQGLTADLAKIPGLETSVDTLKTDLNAEEEARADAIAKLSSKTNDLSKAIENETSARSSADNSLGEQIFTTRTDLQDNIAAEANRAKDKEVELANSIAANKQTIDANYKYVNDIIEQLNNDPQLVSPNKLWVISFTQTADRSSWVPVFSDLDDGILEPEIIAGS